MERCCGAQANCPSSILVRANRLNIEVHLVLVPRWGQGLQRAGGYPVLLAWS